MKRTLEAEAGRLDVVVARMTGAARADVQRAIAAGAVRVDGAPRGKSFRLHGGERLTIEIEVDAPLVPEGPPVPIRFEDEHLAVVAKPAAARDPPDRRPARRDAREPVARDGGPARAGRRHAPARHRASPRRRDVRPPRRGEDRRCLRVAPSPVPRPRGRPRLPRARPGRRRERRVRGRRAARQARVQDRGRRDRGQARGDRRSTSGSASGARPSWRPCPGRGGPTRSASTSRRSGIRSSATAPTAAGETTRADSGSSARSSTPGASPSRTR